MLQIIAVCVRIAFVEFIDKRWAQMKSDGSGFIAVAPIEIEEIFTRCHS
jgi:hypothetical protein